MAGKETVKGTFGNEPIELNNAATETTLFALLKLAQKDSAVLAEMAKKAGIDSKKIQESLDKQGDGGGGGKGGGLGLLGGAANLAGGFLMDMVGGITKTIGNLAAFGEQLMDGTARASDFFKAFKDLPLGLGMFAQLLASAQKFMEKQIDTYRTISQTGAGLTSSLGGLRVQALGLGLNMDEFAAMFAKNQDALARLGGSASAGAKNLVAINNSLINSKMGTTLMGLGYTFSEINGLVGDYIATTGDGLKVGKDVTSEQQRLAKAAGAYGKELDFLSRLTGESRESIQKKMQADAAEASWKMYLAGLPEEQQALAAQAVERARQMGGKGGVDAIKAMFMGFAGPFSQEGQTFISTMNGGTRALQDMVSAVKNNKDATKTINQLDSLFAKGMISNIKDIEKFRTNIMAMGQGADGGAKALLEITEATNVYKAKGMSNVQAIEQAIKDARKKQADDAKTAEAQAKVDLAMKQLGQQLVSALLPIIESLNKIGLQLIKRFSDLVTHHLPDIKDALKKVADFIEYAFNDPEGAWKKISGWFKGMLAKMLETFSTSWLGRKLFGDAAESLGRQSRIESLQGIDPVRRQELIGKGDSASDKEKEELADINKTIREGRLALAQEVRDKAKGFVDESKIYDTQIEAMAKKYGKTHADIIKESQVANSAMEKEVLAGMDDLKKKQIEKQKQANAEANQIELGIGAFASMQSIKDYKVKEFASGTAGSGKLLQDFGREELVKLHGKEAVLTEEQLTNLAKGVQQASGGTTVNAEIGQSDLVVEHLITLNRTTAMQNKILATMVENQRTMINRATGNRLMA
jgi:hypothetical protein